MTKSSYNSKPFDIVIPVGPHDLLSVGDVVKCARKNVIGYRNVYLLSCDPLISVDGAITVDEGLAPFNKDSIKKCFKTEKFKRCTNWYLQQLLKLYAGFFIPGILDDYLVIDADVYFLKPTTFFDDEGRVLLAIATLEQEPYHEPYFDHMARLNSGLVRKYPEFSGICHHMMFNRVILAELIDLVTENNPESFLKVFLNAVDENFSSGASEYEIYFNYMLIFNEKKCAIRRLNWKNTYLKPNRFWTLTLFSDKDYVSQFVRGGYLKNSPFSKFLQQLRIKTKSFRYRVKKIFVRN